MPSARFELLDLLGRGGMADVYRANDKVLGREVAVKVLNERSAADGDLRRRLVREARAVASLTLPAVVQVHDVDPSGRYIVMELVRGETLAQRLKRQPMDAAGVRALAAELLGALEAAHQQGIVHRDVKPSNILLTAGGTAKLTDFGVASTRDGHDLTGSGGVVGTVSYMAPEQLRGGHATARSDVYSAGVTLFEAATGLRFHDEGAPFRDAERAVMRAVDDRGLARAIARAVAIDPLARFGSAHEFLRALERPPVIRWRTALAAVLLVGLVAAAAGLGRRVFRDEGQALLEEGAAALARQDLEHANAVLDLAVVKDEDNAEAWYDLALVRWWRGDEPNEVEALVRGALKKRITPVQRRVLEGLVLLVRNDFPAARTHFEALAAEQPANRDVAYALFEARFHGGDRSAALEAHAQLRRIDPHFWLGSMHVLDAWLSRRDAASAEAYLEGYTAADRHVWVLRSFVAKNDLSGADAFWASTCARLKLEWCERERFLLELLQGRLEGAAASLSHIEASSEQRLLLANVTGDLEAVAGEERTIVSTFASQVAVARQGITKELLMLDAARSDPGGAAELLALIGRLEADEQRGLGLQAGRAFQLGRVHDEAGLEALKGSPYLEPAMVASALLDEQHLRWKDARTHWRAAVEASVNGDYAPAEWLGLARAAHALNDEPAALEACEQVLHPGRFRSSWGSAVGPCLLLSAEAEVRLGQPARAKALLQRLAALRSHPAPGDPLLQAATALGLDAAKHP